MLWVAGQNVTGQNMSRTKCYGTKCQWTIKMSRTKWREQYYVAGPYLGGGSSGSIEPPFFKPLLVFKDIEPPFKDIKPLFQGARISHQERIPSWFWRCRLLSLPLGEQASGRRCDCSGLGRPRGPKMLRQSAPNGTVMYVPRARSIRDGDTTNLICLSPFRLPVVLPYGNMEFRLKFQFDRFM